MGSTSEDTNEPTDIYDWMVRVLFSFQEENNTRLKARRASELTEVIKCKFNRGMMTIWPPTHDNQELHANVSKLNEQLQKLEKATASTLKAFIVTEVYAQGRELSGLYHHPTTSEYRQDLLSAIGDVRSGTWRNTLEEVLHGWWDSEWPSEASLGESPDVYDNVHHLFIEFVHCNYHHTRSATNYFPVSAVSLDDNRILHWPASVSDHFQQIKNAIEVQCLELEKYEILRLQALIKQISDHEISQHDTFWTYDGNGSLSKYRRYAESIAPHEIRTIVDSAREGRRSQATRQSVQSMPGDSGHGNEHGPIRPPPR